MNNIREELHTVENTGDSLIELIEQYTLGSVIVKDLTDTLISVNEIGDKYLEINTSYPAGTVLKITYLPLNNTSSDKTQTRIKELQNEVSYLKEKINTLEARLNSTITINAFASWKALIEEKLDISLDENIFKTYESKMLFNKRSGS